MLCNLLKAFTQESFVWGGFTFLLGLVVIFGGMIILVLSVSAMGMIMKRFNEKNKPKDNLKKTIEVAKFSEESQSDEIPEHVKVAIVAAIYAYYADSGVKNEFKVKKIKRI